MSIAHSSNDFEKACIIIRDFISLIASPFYYEQAENVRAVKNSSPISYIKLLA